MQPIEFITQYNTRHKDGFFSQSRLALTGESLENMRLLGGRCLIEMPDGQGGVSPHLCLCICSQQFLDKNTRGKAAYHYFDISTYEWVLTKR